MAEVSVVGRELAQQIADRGAEPPSLYFHDEENMKGIIEGNLRSINLTQVDISLLNSNSPAADDEARKLFYALSTHGYFFAMNHGMSGDFIEQVRSLMNEFFMLPIEEKLKLKSNCVGPPEEDGNFDGYGFEETTREGGPEEWCDRLSIMISPLAQRKMQYWPDKPVEFGKIMEECSIKAEKLVEQVLIGMARSLNLADEKSFVEEIGSKPQISARFNFYPKCSRPDRVLGLDSHSDGSVLTFLVQDKQVEGLQLLLDDGEWVRVPTTPSDALVISIGDQGEILSNGKFTSRVHRVAVNTTMTRMSLAIFCIPELDKIIGPVKGLVNETTPAKYKKVTNYVLHHLKNAYDKDVINSFKNLNVVDP